MKLLYVIPDMETGGAQRLLADMLRILVSEPDIHLTVAVYTPLSNPSHLLKQILNIPTIKVVSINIPLSGKASLNPFVRRKAISRLRPLIHEADICHAHLFPAFYDVALAAKGCDTTLIFTEHSTDNKRRHIKLVRPFERRIYSRYHAVVSISQAVHQALETWLNLKKVPENFHVIENGIDTRRFAGKIPRLNTATVSKLPDFSDELLERFYEGIEGELASRLSRFGIPDVKSVFGRDGLPVLMVSRFVESKNQEALIRAFHLLKTDPRYSKSIENKSVFLAFAGSGPNLEHCREMVEQLDIADDVLFMGDVNNVVPLMAASAVGVQISNWEGVGLTALEMMAAGLPLIASDIPGLRNTVRDAALLTPNGPEKIAQALASILTPDTPEEFNDLLLRIETGRKISRRHDISRTLDAHLALYRRSRR